jgi:hypothetical protein
MSLLSVSVNLKHDKNKKIRESLICIILMNQGLPSIPIFLMLGKKLEVS